MDYRLTSWDDLAVGQRARFAKTITEADLSHFIAFTGDVNPLHVDQEFARRTFFGQRIAHGMLSASLFSTLIGMQLPGTGAIFKSQTLEFLRPVYLGDTLTAEMEISAIDRQAEQVRLKAQIHNQRGEAVI
ncbi:MAG: MaoC family dehydratase, partial [Candidatus Competibacteraceae bacterium]|nr:MaoC family dehydratase [Candidatus Competibacteraceae bacterium]